MSGVLFVVMPFGATEAPQLGVSLLQAELKRRGIPCDIAYLNLPFAQAAGRDAYNLVTMTAGEIFAGEWLFARSLFSDREINYQGYVDDILRRRGHFTPSMIQKITALTPLVEPFLDYCLKSVDWGRYSIIGFTSMFEQNLPSLSLMKRLRERFPDKTLILGGANCSDGMGVQFHKSFPFVDYVFTGESDTSFPEFVSRLARHAPQEGLQGYVRRVNGASEDTGPSPLLHDLDTLPYPNYDDFFGQLRASGLPPSPEQHLLIETARGCWWGQKHQCSFCGLNPREIPFRVKTPARALDEMTHLTTRYGIRKLMAVDNIVDLNYLATLLPEIRRRKPGFTLFYETKANLKKEQVRLLREAGVTWIQPGIESFSENVLQLLCKGVSPLQNVQLLKWCREFGVAVGWNVLYGFPRENSRDYQSVLEVLRAISHFQAPMAYGPIRMDRHSPIFLHPEEFGIRDVRPQRTYRYLYPFEEDELKQLAYFFEFDFDGKEKVDRLSAPMVRLIEHWQKLQPAPRLEVTHRRPDAVVVQDTRPGRTHPAYRFQHPENAILDYCDEVRRFPDILRFLHGLDGGSAYTDTWLRGFLDYLVGRRLMLCVGDRFLSLILPQPAPGAGSAAWPIQP